MVSGTVHGRRPWALGLSELGGQWRGEGWTWPWAGAEGGDAGSGAREVEGGESGQGWREPLAQRVQTPSIGSGGGQPWGGEPRVTGWGTRVPGGRGVRGQLGEKRGFG